MTDKPDHERAEKIAHAVWLPGCEITAKGYECLSRAYLASRESEADAIAAKERAEAAAEEWHHAHAGEVSARQRATHDAECFRRERDDLRAKLAAIASAVDESGNCPVCGEIWEGKSDGKPYGHMLDCPALASGKGVRDLTDGTRSHSGDCPYRLGGECFCLASAETDPTP